MANEKKGQIEEGFLAQNIRVIGIDEVGRGCIAGPIFAAAVSLNYQELFKVPARDLSLIRDSKTLSALQRQKVLPLIHRLALDFAIASSSVREIESLGIVKANYLAMHKARAQLKDQDHHILIDGRETNPLLEAPQTAIIRGDGLCFCIAAASILAKEARDSFMKEQDLSYPEFGFSEHVGYGTPKHLAAVEKHGITELHRRNFAPITRWAQQSHVYSPSH